METPPSETPETTSLPTAAAGSSAPEAPGEGASAGRAPAGLAALLAGAAASIPVFLFDALEEVAGLLFGDGPAALVGLVGFFGLAWLLIALPVLALLAPRPAREGLGAGALVAVAMLWFLLGDGPPAEEIPIRLFVWVPFSALAVGFGAATGLLAHRLRRAKTPGGRGTAYAALAAMLVFLAVSTLFLGPPGGPLAWGILAVAAVVVGITLAWLATERRRRRPRIEPPAGGA